MYFYNNLFFSLNMVLSTLNPIDNKCFYMNNSVIIVLPSLNGRIYLTLEEKLVILIITSSIIIIYLFF